MAKLGEGTLDKGSSMKGMKDKSTKFDNLGVDKLMSKPSVDNSPTRSKNGPNGNIMAGRIE